MLNEARAALRGLERSVETGGPLRGIVLLAREFDIAGDHQQEIVEVVRHAPLSCPTASIFCACASCCSRSRRRSSARTIPETSVPTPR